MKSSKKSDSTTTKSDEESLHESSNTKKKDIPRSTIKSKHSKPQDEGEPGIKEYLVIFGVAFLIFFGIYLVFDYFDDREIDVEPGINLNTVYRQAGIQDEGFIHPTPTFDGRIANVEFAYDLSSLNEFEFRQDFTREWARNNRNNITIATPDVLPDRLENALLIKTNSKFGSYLRFVEGVRINETSFVTINENTTCENSGPQNPLIIYNYDVEEIGVIIDNEFPYCMNINARTAIDFVKAVDKIMFDTIIR